MKLLLTSSGLRNESQREALRGMLDKPAGECNCVYIPTSYHVAIGDMSRLMEEMDSFMIYAAGNGVQDVDLFIVGYEPGVQSYPT